VRRVANCYIRLLYLLTLLYFSRVSVSALEALAMMRYINLHFRIRVRFNLSDRVGIGLPIMESVELYVDGFLTCRQ